MKKRSETIAYWNDIFLKFVVIDGLLAKLLNNKEEESTILLIIYLIMPLSL